MKKLLASIVSQVKRFAAVNDHGDRVWEFYLPASRRWHYLNVKEYECVYYFFNTAAPAEGAGESQKVFARYRFCRR